MSKSEPFQFKNESMQSTYDKFIDGLDEIGRKEFELGYMKLRIEELIFDMEILEHDINILKERATTKE